MGARHPWHRIQLNFPRDLLSFGSYSSVEDGMIKRAWGFNSAAFPESLAKGGPNIMTVQTGYSHLVRSKVILS